MNKIEVKKIFELLEANYLTFKCTEEMFNVWFDELQQYDYEDVQEKLKTLMASDIFQTRVPSLMSIVKDVPKTQQKLDWNKGVAYCNYCGRAFNVGDVKEKDSMNEIHEHEDRCRSVRYICKQAKKYKNLTVNKGQLYKMSKEEFNEFYDRVLKYVYEHTTDELEKQCIDHIFNPPNAKETKRLFGVE